MSADAWTKLSNEELLERKISGLKLKLEGTAVESWIHQLYGELSAKQLKFHPPCFVADEWFVPEGIPAIGIPFYLTHERLKKLEQKMILEVEGGTKAWFMRLIRHEAGHAYSYAYGFYRKKKWQRLFGVASKEQPPTYKPKPYSRSYVIHLDNWYAQSHPDEDFAETFAVWLTPRSRWRERYANWRALRKLEYIDELMNSIANKPALKQPKYRFSEFSGLGVKLRTYFQHKRKQYEESYPEFYDNDLRRLFTEKGPEASDEKASQFLRTQKKKILNTVAFWTKEKQYTVSQLLRNLIERSDKLKLFVKKNDSDIYLQVSVYITALVTAYLFTGQFKRKP